MSLSASDRERIATLASDVSSKMFRLAALANDDQLDADEAHDLLHMAGKRVMMMIDQVHIVIAVERISAHDRDD